MNRIRKYLIHLLGGVTKECCDRKIDCLTRVERVHAISSVLLIMERCHGMTADDWCKTVYEGTCELSKRAVKNLEVYAYGLND